MNTNYFQQQLRWLLLPVYCCVALALFGQTPFLRTGQAFSILGYVNELQHFSVQAGYNSINTDSLGILPGPIFDAIGYRRTDNLLYGVCSANNHLYRVGQQASTQDVGDVGLDPTLLYLAGDVHPDGRYYYAIGSDLMGTDVHLAITDLETAGFPTQFIPLAGGSRMSDIAFDPADGKLFGFDAANGYLVRINTTTGIMSSMAFFEPGNELGGLYFDAFGDLYGVGSTLFGIVNGFYKMDKLTGKETRLATGPAFIIVDCASCPYSVEIKNAVDPGINLPCTDLTYTFTLVNGSEETLKDLEFRHPIPPGFTYGGVVQNTFGAVVDVTTVPGFIRVPNIELTPGTRKLQVKMQVGDLPKGRIRTQAEVSNLPAAYGLRSISDYPLEPGFEDSTTFLINRFDEDTIGFSWLICYGETLLLQTKDYGNNIKWNNGTTELVKSVTKGGFYSFVAGSTCEQVVVEHDVTSASCPFTIALRLLFEPDTIFACSDVLFRFVVINDSGEPRYNLSIRDSLPPNFSVVEIFNNPVGGVVSLSDPGVIRIDSMDLSQGSDTIDVLVHIDDVPPGKYNNRAVLGGLPVIMGPIRLSDNPYTLQFDSSMIVVQGPPFDSLYIDTIVCEKTNLVLDAGLWGKSFLWDDGSAEPLRMVDQPGLYVLTLFDGCEPATMFWDVTQGAKISLVPLGPFAIHQGETVAMMPEIINLGDTLAIRWTELLSGTLTCLDCPEVQASPIESTVYGLKVSNEVCSDSISVVVDVDRTRRIYTGNIFSPNEDGQNDVFTLQSPDAGFVKSFQVFDRWGGLQFASGNHAIPAKALAWDGYAGDKLAPPGVYIWVARIQFIDGREEVFRGDVTLVR
jgi:gliding motility-associated-like protein